VRGDRAFSRGNGRTDGASAVVALVGLACGVNWRFEFGSAEPSMCDNVDESSCI
jgi:hypothetical protein